LFNLGLLVIPFTAMNSENSWAEVSSAFPIPFHIMIARLSNTDRQQLKLIESHYHVFMPAFFQVAVFSSPEHKVLMVSYCDRALSVVRRRPSCIVGKLFSSPEHKVLRVSYCDRPLSVVRRRASSVVRRPLTFLLKHLLL